MSARDVDQRGENLRTTQAGDVKEPSLEPLGGVSYGTTGITIVLSSRDIRRLRVDPGLQGPWLSQILATAADQLRGGDRRNAAE